MNRRDTLRQIACWPLLAVADVAGRPAAAAADGAPPTRIPAADLLADAALLRRAFETLHPGLLRYNTQAQLAGHFDTLNRSLARDLSLAEAYLAFSFFAARIRCGHTYANFFNQSKAVEAALFERNTRLPVHFVWLGRKMVVTRNFSVDPDIVPGTEILAIDGIPAAAILESLQTVAPADGSNDAKRSNWLQVTGEKPIEAFDVFLPLFFKSIGSRPRLRVQAPDATSSRETPVEALTAARRRELRPAPPGAAAALWTLDTSDPELAILHMPTWAMYNSRWDWQTWLQETFERLAHTAAPALVIDLRANEGGDDVGTVLLAHLTAQALPLPELRRLVRYQRVPDDLAPHLDTWDPSFKDWGSAATRFDERYFELRRDEDDKGGSVVAPRAPQYAGRVFVLIGPANSSATFRFAQEIRQSGLATLVGQPTGGNLRGINGGAFFFLRLPNSGIEVDLPLIGYFPTGDLPPDRGVAPDVMVENTITDIANGVDAALRTVRQLLRSTPRAP